MQKYLYNAKKTNSLEYLIVVIGSTNIPFAVLTDHNPLTVLTCMYCMHNMNQRLIADYAQL